MEWSFSKSGGTEIFNSIIQERNWRKMADALSHFWEKLSSYLLGKQDISNWDRILIEIWIDSGRIIAYPTVGNLINRIDKKHVFQVTMPYLLELSELLPDPDEDPQGFDAKVQELEIEVSTALLRASMRNPGMDALRKLREKHMFQVFIQSADDQGSARFTSV